MRWDDLRYFLAVADTQSLAGASRKLAVNHSTVFRRINQFEKTVGARLFERLPDGYRLTGAGEELYAHAQRVEHEVDALQLKIQGEDYRPSGTVRVTAPDRIADHFLPAYLLEFQKQYPDIRVVVDVGARSLDLTRREADIAIRATAAPPEHLVGREAVHLPWKCFASKRYLRKYGTPKNTTELPAHRVIAADGELQRLPPFRHIDNNAQQAVVMRCSTLNVMAAMVRVGYGLAMLPWDQKQRGLVALWPEPTNFRSGIWLLTHPELRHTERVRLLMNHLHTAMRGDPRLVSD